MEELPATTGSSCDLTDIPCHLTSFGDWLADFLLFIPRKCYDLLMDALASVIEALPIPDAIQQAKNAAGALSGMGYMADLVALKQGLFLVSSALLARFLLRRIPFIG